MQNFSFQKRGNTIYALPHRAIASVRMVPQWTLRRPLLALTARRSYRRQRRSLASRNEKLGFRARTVGASAAAVERARVSRAFALFTIVHHLRCAWHDIRLEVPTVRLRAVLGWEETIVGAIGESGVSTEYGRVATASLGSLLLLRHRSLRRVE